MCGIVFSKSLTGKSVNKTIINRYLAQRSRGIDGFGFYVPSRDQLTHNTKEKRIIRLLRRQDNDEVLFHHRFPTSTSNVRNACHPFSTKDKFENNYIIVHNGVVHNPIALQKQHEALGIQYVSMQEDGRFNDSEALAYDLARYFEGQTDSLSAEGSIAFIAVKRDKKGKTMGLFFGRNSGSPLKMKLTKHSLTISSQGEGEDVEINTLHYFNYDTKELSKTHLTIPTYSYTYNRPYYSPDSSSQWGYPKKQQTFGFGATRKSEPTKILSDETIAEIDDLFEDEPTIFRQRVKEIVEDYQNEADYDPVMALTIASEDLKLKQERIIELDATADEERENEKPSHELDELIEEYLELTEEVELYEAAVARLSMKVAEAIKREADTQDAGFQGNTQPHTTPLSNLIGNTHKIPSVPYAD